MFTNTKAGYVRDGKVLTESACLSTDTKPTTGIANGSCLIEMDTGDRFMFDEANEEWLNITNPGGGGDTGEVWLVGDTPTTQMGMTVFELRNVDETDHMTELFTNAENYDVYANGVALPYLQKDGDNADWVDAQDFTAQTIDLSIFNSSSIMARIAYKDASTAPTSVEVSVKAK